MNKLNLKDKINEFIEVNVNKKVILKNRGIDNSSDCIFRGTGIKMYLIKEMRGFFSGKDEIGLVGRWIVIEIWIEP